MLYKCCYRSFSQLVQHRREIFAQSRISSMTGSVLLTIFKQLIEARLCCASKKERYTLRKTNQADQVCATHVFGMTSHIDLCGVSSKRAGIDADLVIPHRGAHLV